MSGFLLVVNPSEDFAVMVWCSTFNILVISVINFSISFLYSANGCVEISQEISLGTISFIEGAYTIQQNIILLAFYNFVFTQHRALAVDP